MKGLHAACQDAEFERIARSSRAAADDDDDLEEMLGGSCEEDIGIAEVPEGLEISGSMLQSTATSWVTNFRHANEYIHLNNTITTYIADVSSNSALLSDADIAYLSIDAKLQVLTADSFPNLFSSKVDRAILICCWVERISNGMTAALFAALVLGRR
jgi:hypothetical protein